MTIPVKCKPGDTLRVIAPSKSLSNLSQDTIDMATERLSSLGLKVSFSQYAYEHQFLGCASIKQRVDDCHQAFLDPNVSIILTAMGGYQVNQLLEHLDYDLIAQHPKILCGFSDITALQNAIYAQTGLVVYSGMHFSSFASDLGIDYSVACFKQAVMHNQPFKLKPSRMVHDENDPTLSQIKPHQLHTHLYNHYDTTSPSDYWVIQAGHTSGIIVGGNLGTSLLLHGTDYCPDYTDKIVMIEAVSSTEGKSDVYRFERNLQALIHQPSFKQARALMIGRFEPKFGMTRELLTHICMQKPALASMPVIANMDFGHTMPMATIPIGGYGHIQASHHGEATITVEG
ncbi:MAG: S66 peptidase family protein [Pseudomonadota bacterium]|nr:S66 peptidase family protein [Pseudomonadota bacterium]